MKIAAISVVRDELPLLRTNIGYHRSLGVDEFWFADNGSSDGTQDALETESRQHGDLHWTSHPGPFEQSQILSKLAGDAIAAGADWIIPIDADEFWWAGVQSLRDILDTEMDVGGIASGVDNFVQRRSVIEDDARSILSMTYRANPAGSPDTAVELVNSGKIGFVEIPYPPKHILRTAPGLVIGAGNHSARNTAGPLAPTDRIRVLHAPLRSKSDLMRREEHGKRAAATARDPEQSWHVRRWTALADEDRLAEDWAANSQRFGRLHVGRMRRRVYRDLRLSEAVRPFVPT